MKSDYQTLIAAREYLRSRISCDRFAGGPADGFFSARREDEPLGDPERLMRVYGMLAKIDQQIAFAEQHAFSEWKQADG